MSIVINATQEEVKLQLQGNFFTWKPGQERVIRNENLAKFIQTDRRGYGLAVIPDLMADDEEVSPEQLEARKKEHAAIKEAACEEALNSYISRLREVIYNNQVSLRRDLEQANIKSDPGSYASDGELAAMRTVAKYQRRAEDELKKRIQSDTDSFNSKLDLVVSLKKAVAEANLKTIVSFNGREYTVTELLAIKETMAIRDTFLLQLRHQMQLANSQSSEAVTKIQTLAKDSPIENLQETLNTFTNLYGVNIISADSKLSPAEYVAKQITEQESLKNELDLVLSESNIKTMISI